MKKDILKSGENLNPESKIKFDDMYAKHIETLERYKRLKKDVANIKSNIKSIQKANLKMQNELPEGNRYDSIKYEILSIENKYAGIAKAIKKYKLNQKYFMGYFSVKYRTSLDENTYRNLNNYTSNSNENIAEANNCIRITKRYFKNISDRFASHKKLKEIMKLNEAYNLKHQKPPELYIEPKT